MMDLHFPVSGELSRTLRQCAGVGDVLVRLCPHRHGDTAGTVDKDEDPGGEPRPAALLFGYPEVSFQRATLPEEVPVNVVE